MIEPVIDSSSHRKALRQIEALWDAKPGSRQEHELDALATLVDAYEQRAFPISAPTPAEAILLRCEQLGWTRRDLEPFIGSRARVSEVLSGRRSLTLPMIRRLHEALQIPAEILIVEPRRAVRRTPRTQATSSRKTRQPSSRRSVDTDRAPRGSRVKRP
jgi:HTH-type transcriptional regulator / antitoxin HigA